MDQSAEKSLKLDTSGQPLGESTLPSPISPSAQEPRKKRVKKIKPAKGPAKAKAKAFIAEVIASITGDKTVFYRITHPDENGNLVTDLLDFEIYGKMWQEEILSSFGIAFEKVCALKIKTQGRTSVVHIRQATKRLDKETKVPCVNLYGYLVQDGEWERIESSELDKILYTNPQTGFRMPRGSRYKRLTR